MDELNELEILKGARELITPPIKHCKGQYARTETGLATGVFMSNAFQFCGLGAIRKVAGSESRRKYIAQSLFDDAGRKLYQMDVADVNDKLGHHAVLACFDKAINELERTQQAANESAT